MHDESVFLAEFANMEIRPFREAETPTPATAALDPEVSSFFFNFFLLPFRFHEICDEKNVEQRVECSAFAMAFFGSSEKVKVQLRSASTTTS